MKNEKPIVQIAYQLINESATIKNQNSLKIAKDAIKKFINQELSYEEASRILYASIFSTEPLIKIDRIIKLGNSFDEYDYKPPIIHHSDNDPTKSDKNGKDNKYSNAFKIYNAIGTVKKMKSWTPAEDELLIAAIYKYGIGHWSEIALRVGNGRTRNQCSQRWFRALNPCLIKTEWQESEDQSLMRLVKIHGKHAWTMIANEIPGRSDVLCRYRYIQLTNAKRKLKKKRALNKTRQNTTQPEKKKTVTNMTPKQADKTKEQPLINLKDTNNPNLSQIACPNNPQIFNPLPPLHPYQPLPYIHSMNGMSPMNNSHINVPQHNNNNIYVVYSFQPDFLGYLQPPMFQCHEAPKEKVIFPLIDFPGI